MRLQEDEIVSDVVDDEIDLYEIFQVVKHNAVKIIIVALIFGIISGAFTSYFIQPKYSSTSKLYILTNTQSIISVSDLQIGSALTYDYEEMLKSRPVQEQVIENLKLDMTYTELLSMVKIENPENTRMINITVENGDPVIGMQIANELANVSKKEIAKVMKIEEPEIVETAIEASRPSSPNMKKNVFIGLLLGALLSTGVIVVRHIMDNTVATAEDVEKYIGLNTLAVIPDTSNVSKKKKHKNRKDEK